MLSSPESSGGCHRPDERGAGKKYFMITRITAWQAKFPKLPGQIAKLPSLGKIYFMSKLKVNFGKGQEIFHGQEIFDQITWQPVSLAAAYFLFTHFIHLPQISVYCPEGGIIIIIIMSTLAMSVMVLALSINFR